METAPGRGLHQRRRGRHLMPSVTDPWTGLEAQPTGAGRARRRIHPGSSRDLFVELELDTRRRVLCYRRPWDTDAMKPHLPSTQGLTCTYRPSDNSNQLEIAVTLMEPT